MREMDSKIRELLHDAPKDAALKNKMHELLDMMSAEQIVHVIPYLKSLL